MTEWKEARSKKIVEYREPIPNTRLVRYLGELGGVMNPILFPLSDDPNHYETIEQRRECDPEPEKLVEVKGERMGDFFRDYAIVGEDVVVKSRQDIRLKINKKEFEDAYEDVS